MTSSNAAALAAARGSPSKQPPVDRPDAASTRRIAQRDQRLRSRRDFIAVIRQGRRVHHPLLTIRYRPNGVTHNRFGYAIGKRVGTAVVRNRLRRRLRAILQALPLSPGHDIVLTPAPAAANASHSELMTALASMSERSRLLKRGGVPKP